MNLQTLTSTLLPALADVATVIGGIAVLFALVPILEGRKQRLRDAEQWYIDRYWAIQDRIKIVSTRSGLRKRPTSRDIFDELRLCEDEVESRQNGFITSPTWKVWRGSILAIRNDEAKMTILDGVDELDVLKRFLRTGQDPLRLSWLRAALRGLH